ncbi:MAG: phospholipase [bacterium]|nr:phospholipase [bacterium]
MTPSNSKLTPSENRFAFKRVLHLARYGLSRCALALAVLCVVVGVYHTNKGIPEGLNAVGTQYQLADSDLEILTDVSYRDPNDSPIQEQQIFDRLFTMIDNADRLVLLDQFLLNSFAGEAGSVHRRLADELTTHLLQKKANNPGIPIVLITDPINEIYGGDPSQRFDSLRQAGIEVVSTSLDPLRDSNMAYSGLWRIVLRPLGSVARSVKLAHPFDSSRSSVSIRGFLRLVNFKVNHRKVAICDVQGQHWVTMISSANPHDGSSAHSNIAVVIKGALAADSYAAEVAVLSLSGVRAPYSQLPALDESTPSGKITAQLLTESRIRDAILDTLRQSQAGDELEIAVFYLSHRSVVRELVEAARREVSVRLILDPNRDSFGRVKNGIPNRPTVGELLSQSQGKIKVRWYDTHGEQFHCKALVHRGQKGTTAILGSANFTRRNLDGFNLEASVRLSLPANSLADRRLKKWFDRMWTNSDGNFTVTAEEYLEFSRSRSLLSRFQESTGMCTF